MSFMSYFTNFLKYVKSVLQDIEPNNLIAVNTYDKIWQILNILKQFRRVVSWTQRATSLELQGGLKPENY